MRFPLIFIALLAPLTAAEIPVSNSQELQAALAQAKAGDRIKIAPGEYSGAFSRTGLRGTAAEPVVIEGADPANLPRFGGRGFAFHLRECGHVTLRNLRVKGCTGNGINIDDGDGQGERAGPFVFENLIIEETGPQGNTDGLKLSGVKGFTVTRCVIRGWGGQGVDMVGCQDGVIERNFFEGLPGFSQGNAVQIKGGSARVKVLNNVFLNPGQRGINIGGSTGRQFFRPAVTEYEAYGVEVTGNQFCGSMAPIAWVNADGGLVKRNVFVFPEKWVCRILQESRGEPFKPCRGGVFEDNAIVFDERFALFCNIGDQTSPETFTFQRNGWYHLGWMAYWMP